jgi:hypothetical protein
LRLFVECALEADLGMTQHSVVDVLIEPKVCRPALTGHPEIVDAVVAGARLRIAQRLAQFRNSRLVQKLLGLREP